MSRRSPACAGRMKNQEMKTKAKPTDCEHCEAECCRYVAIEIDTPTCKRDYDNIRWYLLHEDMHVFVDHHGDWFVEFITACRELGPDNRCRHYDDRPRLCREHGDGDESCEFRAAKTPYRRRFSGVGEFEDYLVCRGIEWQWAKT